ncbi:MAG TPA: glutamate--tRNA ligase [Methanoculleus sp.]|nr:glutamate--tRNA ligase [Methanoculleus sp.]
MAEGLREILFVYALENAVRHRSVPKPGAVMGTFMGRHADFRDRANEVAAELKEVLAEVDALTPEEREERLAALAPDRLRQEKRKSGGARELPALEYAEEGVVMRFAPNPSGPLHLGHARAAYLNDYYVRRYDGHYVIRIEDTDPRRVEQENYGLLLDDIDWLGLKVGEIVYQSDRMDIYYEHCRRLIELGGAYACMCDAAYFRDLKLEKRACPCRNQTIEENLGLWDRMLEGAFCEGMITVRVKTDLEHPDPAMRDFSIFRIVDTPLHPRIDTKVYPMYNFSVVVDDHLLGITHVIRGKDHIANTRRQRYIYDYFSWKPPVFKHYGRLSIGGVVLSTSAIKEGIVSGVYSGWDDIHLGTLKAIARRGFEPDAVRKAMIDIGIGETDITFSWENLFAQNKAVIDPRANRYFFVPDPVRLPVADAPVQTAEAALHPNEPERGVRRLLFEGSAVVPRREIEGKAMVRLKDLFNVNIAWKGEKPSLTYAGESLEEARNAHAPIIQWLPPRQARNCILKTPDGEVEGYCEEACAAECHRVVQFERVGFARIDAVAEDLVTAYFAHR